MGTEILFCYKHEVSMVREQRMRTMDGDQKKKKKKKKKKNKGKGEKISKVEEQRGRIKEEESI